MSQSDYLNFKRVSNELKINKFTPVFNTKDYIDFKEYSIQNNITNTKLTYNQLCPSGYTKIFNKGTVELRDFTIRVGNLPNDYEYDGKDLLL
jgi:hypothetical protein